MKQLLALTLLIGIVKKPELCDYWSTNALLKGSVFNSVMPCNHYQSILQFLNFADNSQFDLNDPDHERLYKVRSLVDHHVSKFKSTYIPEKEISVDEKTCVQTVHHPQAGSVWNKMFSLCENSGHLWNSYVNLGKEPDRHAADRQLVNRLGSSGAVMPRLMENLLITGMPVKPSLLTCQNMMQLLVALPEKNRLKLPATIKTTNLLKGELSFRRHENMLVGCSFQRQKGNIVPFNNPQGKCYQYQKA